MDQMIKKTLGKIKGTSVPKAICMEPNEIEGKKPHVKLDNGRSAENAFSAGRIS